MSVSTITNLADFIGPTLVPHDVERNGRTMTFWFEEAPQDRFEEILGKINDKDPSTKRGVDTKIIAAVVRTEDGKPQFTREEAAKLPRTLQQTLVKIALKLNGFGKDDEAEAKNA